MGHKTEWSRTIGRPALRHVGQPRAGTGSTSSERAGATGTAPMDRALPGRVRTGQAERLGRACHRRSSAESPRPDVRERVSPDLSSRPGRPSILRARASAPGGQEDGRARRSDDAGRTLSVSRRWSVSNRTTLSRALQACSIADRAGPPGTASLGRNRSGPRPWRAMEGGRSQPIRGAARANGMAAVWGDLVSWDGPGTATAVEARPPPPPGLDQLDERCLLSTGAGTALAHHAVAHHASPRCTLGTCPRSGPSAHGARDRARRSDSRTGRLDAAGPRAPAGTIATGHRRPSTRSSAPRRPGRPTTSTARA